MKEKQEKTKKVKNEGKKKKSKDMKIIPILTIALAMVLVAMVGFFGVYVQKQNRMEDQVKGYKYAMDLNGARTIILNPAESSDTNSEDVLTTENYKKTKEIIENRFKELGVQDYNISLNEENGQITIETEENEETDNLVSNLALAGKFTIIDKDTQEVLMNSNDIKKVQVLSGPASSSSNAVAVYLDIQFTKEGTEKFEKITETYTGVDEDTNKTEEETTEEETTETEDKSTEESTDEDSEKTNEITMKIDDQEMMSTSFDEVIKTGKIQLTYGTSSTDQDIIKDNVKNAQNLAVILNNGEMPVKYDINKNEFILSDITSQDLQKVAYTIAIIAVIGIIIWIIRYHLNGFISGIAFVGFAGLYLLLIRYANVILSVEGILGIIVVLILNYMLMNKLLKKLTTLEDMSIGKAMRESYKEFFLRILPICIVTIVFCFINWTPISSFGMVMFWGILLIFIYNYGATYSVLKLAAKGGKENEAR